MRETIAMRETIVCRGHENVLSTHKATIEITKELELTKKGDCIVGVGADRGFAELSPSFLDKLKGECGVEIVFECGGVKDVVHALGSPDLVLDHPGDMVIRKSGFVDNRTLAVNSDKAAADLSRELVEVLKGGGELLVTLSLN